MIKVLIVEDEPDLLRRFSDAVASNSSLKICGAVGSVTEAKAAIDQQSPDVVLTDLGLPDGSGIEVIRYAIQANSDCDVLVVTMFGDDGNVLDSIAAGAAGYLIKDAMTSDLVDSILEVRKGGSPISPAIARKVLQRFKVSIKPVAVEVENGNGQLADSPLSKRETEILRLVAKGLNFKEIGDILSLSSHTVTTHVKHIYKKLEVHSRGEAVYEATQHGII